MSFRSSISNTQAFPHNGINSASELVIGMMLSCPSHKKWQIVFIGTGFAAGPEIDVVNRIVHHPKLGADSIQSIYVCDNAYQHNDMRIVHSDINKRINVNNKLVVRKSLPSGYDWPHSATARIVISFTLYTAWLGTAFNVAQFLSESWISIARSCNRKDRLGLVDLVFSGVPSFNRRFDNVPAITLGSVYVSSLTDVVEMQTRKYMFNVAKINTKNSVPLEYYPPDEARDFARHMCASFNNVRNVPVCGLMMYNNAVDIKRQRNKMANMSKKASKSNNNGNRRKIPRH